jgi:hypothetical protein
MANPRSSRKCIDTSVPRTSAGAPTTSAGNGMVTAAVDLMVGEADVVTGYPKAWFSMASLSSLELGVFHIRSHAPPGSANSR